jgi:hypothetical protein
MIHINAVLYQFCGQERLKEFVPLYNSMIANLLFFTFFVNYFKEFPKEPYQSSSSMQILKYINLSLSEDLNTF